MFKPTSAGSTECSLEETRGRLLASAGEIFAEKGFQRATVREICARARANVAAVNYHFGDKLGLYQAVLGLAHRSSLEKYPPDLGLQPGASTEERLGAFVRSFLLRIFDQGQPAWMGKLMSREIMEPTPALDTLVSEEIRPRWELLESIVRDLLGRAGGREAVRLHAMSVVAQCLFYFHSRPVIERLLAGELDKPGVADRLASHITSFSLLALRGVVTPPRRSRSTRAGRSAASRGSRRIAP